MKGKKWKALSFVLAGAVLTTTVFSSCKQTNPEGNTSEIQDNSEPVSTVVEYTSKEVPKLSLYIDETAEGYGTIEEMNKDPRHQVKCTGTMDLDIPDGYMCDYSATPLESVHDVELNYVRGRGNSTWMLVDKKPYKIKLEEKMDLFGMGENKEWALLASYYDPSMLRNRCAFYLGEKMELSYTPQGVPVELYMNDEYLGCYILSEIVDIGNGRVEIDELEADDTKEPEISGGYLFSVMCENYLSPESRANIIETDNGVYFLADNPSFDPEDGEVSKEQKEYLRNYLQETEDAIMSNADNIGDYLDLKSAADYWWIQEFVKNEDAFITTSSYLYKERDGKLYFGPLWDFDSSWDYHFYNPRPTDGLNNTVMPWIDHLRLNNPEFQDLLAERYKVLDAALEEMVKDGGVIDRYAGENRDAWEKDHEKWGYYDREEFVIIEAGDPRADYTYDDIVGVYKDWIKERREWIKNNYDEITNIYCDVTFESEDGEKVDVYKDIRIGSTILDAPLGGPEKEDYVFTGWKNKDTGDDILETIITGPTTFVPEYILADDTQPAEEIRFGIRSFSMPVGMEKYTPQYVTLPEENLDKRMEWKSSDEKVVTVDEYGRITALKEGDALITATLLCGASDVIKVHVYEPEDEDHDTLIQFEADEKIKMKAGQSMYLDYTFTEINTKPKSFVAEVNSGDEEVATVDAYGLITAVAPGTTELEIYGIRGGNRLDRFYVELTVE